MRPVEPVTRFNSKYIVSSTGCWLWQDRLSPYGYGKLKVHGEMVAAHRFSYETFVGEIPRDHEVNHTCHSDIAEECGGGICIHRSCVNPDHLESIDRIEHRSKSYSAVKTLCVRGHVLQPLSFVKGKTKRNCPICDAMHSAKYRERLAVKL